MKNVKQLSVNVLLCCLGVLFICSCKSYSKYTIDEKPSIKIDTGLCGIWRAVEDTDKANYVFVQNYFDVHGANYTEFSEKKDYLYYITYFNRHGRNPLYQQWHSFISKVDGATFLNIPYRYSPFWYEHKENGPPVEGFFFVRLIKISAAYDTLVTAIVSDTTLKSLTSSKEVRNRVKKNVNNPTFYSDTLHFYRVSQYHSNLRESTWKANPRAGVPGSPQGILIDK